MNAEKTPTTETSQNSAKNAAEQNSAHQKRGSKILGIIKNLFVNKEKQSSEYYLLRDHATARQREALKDVYDDWDDDEIPKMPRELGEMLESYVDNPDIWFGVHRSSMINGRKFENDPILQQSMREGLVNLGDASSSIVYQDPPVSKAVTYCKDMLQTVILVKSNYKNSTGAILAAVPQKYLDKDGRPKPGCEDIIYNHNSVGSSFLKPEFLVGFVQNLGMGTTLKFKTRDEILAAAAKKEQKN